MINILRMHTEKEKKTVPRPSLPRVFLLAKLLLISDFAMLLLVQFLILCDNKYILAIDTLTKKRTKKQ